MDVTGSGLTAQQRELIATWLPRARVVHDHSWGLVGTTVLELVQDGERFILKAGDAADSHIARELRAHREWLHPLMVDKRAPQLVQGNRDAKLLLTRYLLGHLVEGHPEEGLPDSYVQAGALLARLHEQLAVEDATYEAKAQRKAREWLRSPHRIAPSVVRRLVEEIEGWDTPPVIVVPTHGDWQPRNWLVHEGSISVIDFGRAALRPALTDFERLEAQQFLSNAELENAFLQGYGRDPRVPELAHRNRLRAAIGTAVWAHQVGDEAFERQGHRMIAQALETSTSPVGEPS